MTMEQRKYHRSRNQVMEVNVSWLVGKDIKQHIDKKSESWFRTRKKNNVPGGRHIGLNWQIKYQCEKLQIWTLIFYFKILRKRLLVYLYFLLSELCIGHTTKQCTQWSPYRPKAFLDDDFILSHFVATLCCWFWRVYMIFYSIFVDWIFVTNKAMMYIFFYVKQWCIVGSGPLMVGSWIGASTGPKFMMILFVTNNSNLLFGYIRRSFIRNSCGTIKGWPSLPCMLISI